MITALRFHTPTAAPRVCTSCSRISLIQRRQHRYYSDSNHDQNRKLRSEAFRNYTYGSAQLVAAAAGLFALWVAWKKEEKVDEKERRNAEEMKNQEHLVAAAKMLGLERVITASYRTLDQQAEEYRQAKHEIFIIGTSGARLLDPGYKTSNPIPATIQALLSQGVKVHLMIYNPNNANGQLTPVDVAKINKILPLAKNLRQAFPDHFECRRLTEIPPFHGDLIDGMKALVIPIQRSGIHSTNHALIETYGSGKKISLIRADFVRLWQNSDKVN